MSPLRSESYDVIGSYPIPTNHVGQTAIWYVKMVAPVLVRLRGN